MRVNQVDWSNYVAQMSSISQKAGEELRKYIEKHGLDDKQVVISFAYDLYKKYASASSALACEMYDEVATLSKASVPLAETADLYDFKDVAKNINGTLKQNQKPEATMERMVKQAGADTMMKNAKRDRAQWAWIPSGDTCAFCLMLASRGWQYASDKTLAGNHAQHIHAHCKCQFMIRFNSNTSISGYNPEKYKDIYDNAKGTTSDEKVKSIRKMLKNGKVIASNEYVEIKDIKDKFTILHNGGIGKLSYEKDTLEKDKKTAKWLFDNYGGDIKCLKDNPKIGKMPDCLWDDEYFEFKEPSTKTAIDKRIRNALHQLKEANKRDYKENANAGIVLDITNRKIERDEAIDEIQKRLLERINTSVTVIIKENDNCLKIYQCNTK